MIGLGNRARSVVDRIEAGAGLERCILRLVLDGLCIGNLRTVFKVRSNVFTVSRRLFGRLDGNGLQNKTFVQRNDSKGIFALFDKETKILSYITLHVA